MKRLVIFVLFLAMVSFGESQTIIVNSSTILNYAPRIGLALGGGSAKGLHHLGVLKVLEDEHIPISAIAGTSMGAVVGGFYALGYSVDQIVHVLDKIDIYNTFKLVPLDKYQQFTHDRGLFHFPNRRPVGFLASAFVEDLLRNYTLDSDFSHGFKFDNYPIPLRIVATDISDGGMVVFDKGPLYQAIVSSISIPLFFKPYYWRGHYYIDGSLAENVPVSALKQMDDDFDLLIAVDVMGSPLDDCVVFSSWKFYIHLFDVTVQNLTKEALADADMVISIPGRENLTRLSFNNYDKFIEHGAKFAKQKLPQIRRIVENFDKQRVVFIRELKTKDDIVLPNLFEKVSLTKLIRDIYYLNDCQPLTLELLEQEGGYNISVSLTKIATENSLGIVGEFSNSLKYQLVDETVLAPEDKGEFLLYQEVFDKNNKSYFGTKVARINEVIITGNDSVSEMFIRNKLNYKLPEIYRQSRLEKAISNLYETGLFTSIYYSLAEDGEHGVILTVEIEENPRVYTTIGASYFSEEESVNFDATIKYLMENRLDSFFTFDVHDSNYKKGFNYGATVFKAPIYLEGAYQQNKFSLDIYDNKEHEVASLFEYDQANLSFTLWSDTYDFVDIYFGWMQQIFSTESSSQVNDIWHRNAFLYGLRYDSLDKNWLPEKGLAFKLDFSKGNSVETVSSRLWYSKTFLKNTFWVQQETYHSTLFNSMILWRAPQKALNPNGFMFNEAFSADYTYSRFSYLFPIAFGSKLELNGDFLTFRGVDGDVVTSRGWGSYFRYPSKLGLLSIGYGVTGVRGLFYFSLTKEI